MAPEVVSSPSEVDARSDVYAVGAVAYHLLTGSSVFTGQTAVEILAHHLHSAPIPPSERLGRTLPKVLDALVMRCLASRRPDPALARRP